VRMYLVNLLCSALLVETERGALVTLAFIWSGEVVGWMLFWIIAAIVVGKLFVWYNRPIVEVGRIAIHLKCSTAKAKEIDQYLKSEEITWMQFLNWTNAAINVFMPMFAFRGDTGGNRLIATWQETRKAIIRMCDRRALKRDWNNDKAIGEIAAEILRERMRGGGIANLMRPRSQ